MSYHSALDLYLCNLLRLQVTTALLGLSSIGSSHGLFSLVNMNFLSGAKVQNQCTKAVAESVVVMLAASLFVSASVLWWDWVKVSAGEDLLEYFSSCVMSGGLRAGIFFLVGSVNSLSDRKFENRFVFFSHLGVIHGG